jgi:hypothetical protein
MKLEMSVTDLPFILFLIKCTKPRTIWNIIRSCFASPHNTRIEKTLAIDPRAALKADVQMRYIEPNVQTKWGGGYVKMMNQWGMRDDYDLS